jgi:formate hydrogenlyase subunit 3/multisubunit Na+/H+ antiporter MnhD subunit
MNVGTSYIEMIVLLPVITGILLFMVPEKLRIIKGIIGLVIAAVTLYFAWQLYNEPVSGGQINLFDIGFLNRFDKAGYLSAVIPFTMLNVDSLARFIVLLISFFSLLILVYSILYVTKEKALKNYYPFVLLTLGVSALTVLADSLLLFIFCWGFLGLTLYKLIKGYDEESSAAAKKTFILIGASDGIMILGIAIIWKITGLFNMSEISVGTTDAIRITAFLALLIGSFTKAGAFPFHTWVPDYTKSAPASSSAYLPASLDKLLGIYFMFRICNGIFMVNQGLRLTILIMGVLTIIIAVMMALIQHNYKKLLGYHAISQVGYMIVGLGLGTVLGLAGGLFHMLNNALYKAGLFLVAGNVEKQTGKEELEELGGLSGAMPITFIAALIFALSISGIPPFNGFASKWMIYQGIIDFGKQPGMANHVWIIWLALAVIGSALTLASFIKFISGIFLGRRTEANKVTEVNPAMWSPVILLALICLVAGVFASRLVIPRLFEPILGEINYTGIWDSSAIALLILFSIILGVLIYLIGNIKRFRKEDSFIGGEVNRDQTGYAVVDFYKTIGEAPVFKYLYNGAEKKWFDLYDLCKGLVLKISQLFSAAHNGILSNLAFWVLAGLIFMFIFLLL